MVDKIYPDLTEEIDEAEQNKVQIYNKNLSDHQVNKNLSNARIKEIQVKRHELEQSLKHYKKILKITSLVFLSVSTVCGITGLVLTTAGIIIIPVLGIIVVGAVGSIEGVISETFVLGLIKKKTTLFKKKIDHIQEFISRSWYL